MNISRLALCPVDPHWIPPDDKRLDQFLQSIELSGKALQQPLQFLPGNKFLDLIAFMGCSPDINLEPGDDERPFCSIHVQEQAETVEFHFGGLEAEIAGARGPTHRDENGVDLHRFIAERNGHATLPHRGRSDGDPGADGDAARGQLPIERPGRLGIGLRDYLLQHLEQVNLVAEIRQHRGELTADGTGADHSNPAGVLGPVEGVV